LVFNRLNISGTFETHGQNDVEVRISIDGGEWIYANYTGEDWTLWWIEFDTSLLSDGEHLIIARISSEFFEKEERILILVDNHGNKPPVLSLNSHRSGDTVTKIVSLSGSSDDFDGEIESVAVKIDDEEWIVANNLGGDWRNWSYSFDSMEYPNGTHKISVTAIDNSSESTSIAIDLFFENEMAIEKADKGDFSFVPLLAVIVPLLLCVILFLVIKRKKDRELRERYSEEEDEIENGST
jgi:hypothetical protein